MLRQLAKIIPCSFGLCVIVLSTTILLTACGRITVTGSPNSATGGVATAPTISAQPQSASATAGQSTSFSVTATGTAPLIYQWRADGGAISGANSSSYNT